MRTRGRVDNEQADIVAALRKSGAFVQSLANIGHGCPDLLVGYDDSWHLLEVKAPRAKLTDDEFNWHAKAVLSARVDIVHSPEEALKVIIANRKRGKK